MTNDNWTNFLSQQGAHIENGITSHFSDISSEVAQALNGTLITDLSHFSVIKVTGTDAETFLHNQFTNDLKAMALHHNQLSAYCNPKGRMLALFQISRIEDGFLLTLPGEITEPTLKRLKMFVLRSDVQFENLMDQHAHIGLSGAQAEQLLSDNQLQTPSDINELTQNGETLVIRIPGPADRFRIIGPTDTISKLWESGKSSATPAGANAWEYLDIQAGLPVLHQQTVESFVPQMVNLEAAGGLSFTKGCYPGQEVVARMQYLGKLKRRMYRASLDSDASPQAGDLLYIRDSEENRKAGEIVAAQPRPDGGIEMLAVLEIAVAESGKIFLESNSDKFIEILPLPYTINT